MKNFSEGKRYYRICLVVLPVILICLAASLTGMTTAQATGAQYDEYTTGSISGSVTDGAGQPVACLIFAYSADTLMPVGNMATDAAGNYAFAGLQPGSYKLRFYHPSGSYVTEYYSDKTDIYSANPVSVTAGSDTAGINASLADAGSISGTVTNTTGLPLANIFVSVTPASGSGGGGYSYTDIAGNYSVGSLAAGSYRVQFLDQNYFATYAGQFYNNKNDWSSANFVGVSAGIATTGISASLAPAGSISGTVTDTNGQPLPNIQVCVTTISGTSSRCTNTDANGNYEAHGLAAGSYTVQFRDGSISGGYIDQYYSNKSDVSSANPVQVSAGTTTTGIDASMASGGSITGVVTDEAGQPLSSIPVIVYSPTGGSVGFSYTDAGGNYLVGGLATGSYKVGFGYCYYSPCAPVSYFPEYYENKHDFGSADTVAVTVGLATIDINAALEAAGSISGTVTDDSGQPLSNISVTVYTAAGAYSGSTNTDSSGNYSYGGLAAGGYKVYYSPTCYFTECITGNYLPEYYNDKVDLVTATAVFVTAGNATAGVSASLATGGSITGTVTNAAGQPLPHISVSAYTSQMSWAGNTYTDAAGNYSLGRLATGSYKVVYAASCSDPSCTPANYLTEYYNDEHGGMDFAEPVAVTQGIATTGINASLESGGSITGHVTNEDGQPVSGINITVYGESGGWIGNAVTDASGNYTANRIGTGNYRVYFNAPSCFYPGCIPLNYVSEYYNDKTDYVSADLIGVTAGSTTTGIDATLASGGSISGTVTDDGGFPLSSVHVSLFTSEGSYAGYTYTDMGGHYSVSGLATGDYKLEFRDYSGNHASQYYSDKSDLLSADSVAVTQGSSTEGIDVSLATGGIISGTVTNEAGEPLANISVRVYTENEEYVVDTYTDVNGNYQANRLGTGNYKVSFTSSSCSYPNCTPANYVSEYYNDKADFASSDPVAVTVGSETTGIDASLAAGGTIAGTVTDGAGQPLFNINVTVYTESGEWAGYAYTDANGNYSAGRLPSGSYKVEYRDLSGNHLAQYYNGKQAGTADLVDVTLGSTTSGIDVTLATPAVPCGARPDLQLSLTGAYWGSYADFLSRKLSVNYLIGNPGGPDVAVLEIPPYADNNAGVTVASDTAILFPDGISTGASVGVTMTYNIPAGVSAFKNTIHAYARDACGITFDYPPMQVA